MFRPGGAKASPLSFRSERHNAGCPQAATKYGIPVTTPSEPWPLNMPLRLMPDQLCHTASGTFHVMKTYGTCRRSHTNASEPLAQYS
jgi:hypothetical protein